MKNLKKDYCLFCDRDDKEEHHIVAENDLFFARFDNFPVSAGHAEIIPKRHIVSFFELSETEFISMYDLIKITKEIIEKEFKPDGYNIGLNEGIAAGRSIDHFHLHIIPRYTGDVANPRGGIRHIIKGKGNY
jgi:diadenosine tetraphosphate (Ap4A) HIT family hydrolase